MKKRILNGKINRIFAIALSMVMGFSSIAPAFAAEAVKKSNYVISKVDTAKAELEKLSKSRSIAAAIYLKDAYTVKSEADQYSEDVITIASGQSVSIISVNVDAGRNIWYKVSYTYAGKTVMGYVEREFLVSSDSRFLSWEDKYITTLNREAVRDNSDCSDIEAFPESYRDALYELRKTHPNWRFVRQEVGLDWNTVIKEEASGERSLISGSADSSFKDKPSAGTAGWYIATNGIIAYYMDPRNFLNKDTVFMFEQETFNANVHNSATVAKVLNGTFMSGGIPGTNVSYADTFVSIGANLNMSPIALASRVKQEQGVSGTSPLISGTYPGFEGYFNYYNVKANGSTKEAIYKNGLTYAKSVGWNTRVKSLEGGAAVVANQYVKRGQDTLYLQKFDVDASDKTLYSHQYMQNIAAPYSEALSTYKAYDNAGLLDTPFVFKIPVYTGMPKGRCNKPNAKDVISLNVENVENLPVDQNAVLISLINGGQNTDVPMIYESTNNKVATVDNNGVITGIAPGTVSISAKRAENTTNTASCKVTVIKADIALSKVEIPEINVGYDAKKTLKDIVLPAGFAWVDSSVIPVVANEGYSVVYSPDNSKYNALTMTIPVAVSKAVVDSSTLSLPKALTIDAGSELSSVALPDGFVWKDETVTAPKKTGNVSFAAVYCTDPANFEPANIEISVKVVCKSHEYGDWTGTAADCEHDANLTRKCVICGSSERLEEKATGHNYENAVTKEPTTKEAGIRTYTCTKCQDTYTEEIPKLVPAHVHKYAEKITVQPGCLTTGEKTFTCSCGDSYTQNIDALGHDYGDKLVCKRCKYELPVVPEHIHDYTFSNDTATCTEDGEKIYSCGCGESYSEPSKKTGHSMENGVCSKCGYGEVKPTPTAVPTKAPEPTKKAEPTPTKAAEPTKKVEPTPTKAAEPTKVVKPTPTKAAEPTKKVEPTPTKAAEPTKKVETNKNNNESSSKTDNTEASSTETVTSSNSDVAKPDKNESAKENKASEVWKPSSQKKDNAQKIDKTDGADKKDTAEEVWNVATETDDESEGNEPVSVAMLDSPVLNKEKIEEFISGDSKRLEITMANDVKWDIDLSETDDYSQIDIDLSVSFDDAQIPQDVVDSVVNDKDYTLIELAHDGHFPCEVTMKLPVEEKYIGKIANLFYYSPDMNELQYVGECRITDECVAAFEMKHASAYVMIYNDISMDPALLAAIDNFASGEITEESDSRGVLAGADQDTIVSAGGVNIILYGAIAIIIILMISLVAGILIRSKSVRDYDEEEDE